MFQKEEEIRYHLEEIKKSGKLVIVEGKKDKIALEKLGISNIITLSKKPIFEIIEDASKNNKEILILTDLDKEGKKLFGKLNSGFLNNGVKVDKKFREFLFKNTKLRQIEGISNYHMG